MELLSQSPELGSACTPADDIPHASVLGGAGLPRGAAPRRSVTFAPASPTADGSPFDADGRPSSCPSKRCDDSLPGRRITWADGAGIGDGVEIGDGGEASHSVESRLDANASLDQEVRTP